MNGWKSETFHYYFDFRVALDPDSKKSLMDFLRLLDNDPNGFKVNDIYDMGFSKWTVVQGHTMRDYALHVGLSFPNVAILMKLIHEYDKGRKGNIQAFTS